MVAAETKKLLAWSTIETADRQPKWFTIPPELKPVTGGDKAYVGLLSEQYLGLDKWLQV